MPVRRVVQKALRRLKRAKNDSQKTRNTVMAVKRVENETILRVAHNWVNSLCVKTETEPASEATDRAAVEEAVAAEEVAAAVAGAAVEAEVRHAAVAAASAVAVAEASADAVNLHDRERTSDAVNKCTALAVSNSLCASFFLLTLCFFTKNLLSTVSLNEFVYLLS